MSDTGAEMRGPITRRRRTTVTGGGAASVKQVNGSKGNDAGEKPAKLTGKAKTEDEAHNHASKNGKGDRERMSGQYQHQNSPRKQRSVVEDINEKLR